MPLLTPEECIEQCRAEPEEAGLLAKLLLAAESAVAGYLNRSLFATQTELSEALDALPALAGAAQEAYESAIEAAAQQVNATAKAMAIAVAEEKLADEKMRMQRILVGMVVTPRVDAAVRLTLGNLYANREEVVTGVSAVRLPQGIPELLRPDRKVMMP
ncbi:phage gp6-like head-tail connector protein [Bordetella bronchiseptica]|uniref:phage gp6-like head-tail connector protein n=1 Tax=Bordetella bronchiseptica TaxID=518 RepID=UPI00067E10DF|nr:phage gp6-like head-tail connector protein [Bordetella bronchiseptica]